MWGGWCGWVIGVVCKVIFMSNPTAVLRLCCVVVGVVTIGLKASEIVKMFYFELLTSSDQAWIQLDLNSFA